MLNPAACLQKPRKDGNTPLHEAAQCGDEKLLIALMRLGGDRFSRNQVLPALPAWWASCHQLADVWLSLMVSGALGSGGVGSPWRWRA